MSAQALRDLNVLQVPGPEKKSDSSNKGSITKPDIEKTNENLEKCQNKGSAPLLSVLPNEHDLGATNGVEIGIVEVLYIESENLNDLFSVDTSLMTLLARLDSKDWVSVCEALNNVRQISLYHKEKLVEMLGDVVPLIVKSLKNPRSAVCKTAIMTSADIFKVYRDSIIDLLDPLLVQLLLKSSQDKQFVCEAAETALIAMTSSVSPTLLLPKLQPNLKHKNPRIRAKASMCLSRSVPRLGIEGIKAHGIDKLIEIAASQLSDRLPESREAARSLALELQTIFETSRSSSSPSEEDLPDTNSWEAFCHAKLSPLNAQALLRVTSTTSREGLVLGC